MHLSDAFRRRATRPYSCPHPRFQACPSLSMPIHPMPSLFSLALAALRRYPERVAFQSDGGQLRYGEAVSLIGRFQAALHRHGIQPGTRVALLSANRADMWCAAMAAQGLGAATSWLHPMGSLDAHCFQIEDADVAAVIIDAANYGHRAGEIAARLPDTRILTLGSADAGIDMMALAQRAAENDPVDLSSACAMATLSYTGGTTGRPKGVAKSGGANGHVALQMMSHFDMPLAPRFLAVAPISHVTGTNVVPTLLRGGTVHLMARFDPEEMAQTIARERINAMMMVPTMVYGLLDHPRFDAFDLSSLQTLLYAGAPMSRQRLVEGIERIGPVFCQLYGQSECSPITALRKQDHDLSQPALLDACGFPLAGCEVRLLDEDHHEVPPGQHGEICVRSPAAMSGYWRQPALTEQAFAGGWLHTGDIARADDCGRLFIVDRKKDMIVSGGFNVYPREVEDALATDPAVSMGAVIGVPDPKWGEAVLAYVVLRAGKSATADELIRHVKGLKGSVNTPKRVEIVTALPLTALGKLDKKALRARHWSGQGRNVA
jgi:fatty-acyl-CoA synthase